MAHYFIDKSNDTGLNKPGFLFHMWLSAISKLFHCLPIAFTSFSFGNPIKVISMRVLLVLLIMKFEGKIINAKFSDFNN